MKIRKNLCLLLVIVMSLSFFAGCTSDKSEVNNSNSEAEKVQDEYGVKIDKDTVTFADARGKEVTYDKNPERVVCIYNSFLDLWYKCGGTVVGRIEASEDKPIPGSEDAEVVGTQGAPSVEKIIALKPDLVIMSQRFKAHRGMLEMLEQNDIEVISLDIQLKEDYFKL